MYENRGIRDFVLGKKRERVGDPSEVGQGGQSYIGAGVYRHGGQIGGYRQDDFSGASVTEGVRSERRKRERERFYRREEKEKGWLIFSA